MEEPIYEGLKYVLTCSAYPEQYDVLKDEKLVGYVRLRHGLLRCCLQWKTNDRVGFDFGPDLFSHQLKCERGDFKNAKQRNKWLRRTAIAINAGLVVEENGSRE